MWTKDNLNMTNVLFYMPSINRFIDGQWYIVHDVNQLFDNWQLYKWKKYKKDTCIVAKNGIEFMMWYLSDTDEEEVLDFISWNESHGIKMDRIYY